MILILNDNAKEAQTLSEIFRHMGILATAATTGSFYKEYSSKYRAILVMEELYLKIDLAGLSDIRAYSQKTPVFALLDGCEPRCDATSEMYDGTLRIDGNYVKMTNRLIDAVERLGLIPPGCYALAGLYAGADRERVLFFDTPLHFTKTETMLLRYLMASYPVPQRSEDILRYSFKPTRMPEPSSIRTHISVINKKFRQVTGDNLISTAEEGGYIILTPEILASRK